MVFREDSFYDFVKGIKKTGRKIICYGAGMLPLYIEPFLRSYGIACRVSLFIDRDLQKKGRTLRYANRDICIETPGYLANLDAEQYVILITAEKYKEIQRFLAQMEISDKWECYAYPLLNLAYFKNIDNEWTFPDAPAQIPKTIHYIWFGGPKKTELQKRCIDSWYRFCPDFKIQEWNEENYDVRKNQYMEQAYENRKWAYASDYARLDILYQNGGVYLDTDVELFRSLEPLLNTRAFLCFGEWPVPNSGAGIGCIKGEGLLRELMNTRENLAFLQEDGQPDFHTNSNYEMGILMNHGFGMDFMFQVLDSIALYPPDVIAPASATRERAFITERTLGIHYCQNTWRDK